eukprot:gene11076-9667_t
MPDAVSDGSVAGAAIHFSRLRKFLSQMFPMWATIVFEALQ